MVELSGLRNWDEILTTPIKQMEWRGSGGMALITWLLSKQFLFSILEPHTVGYTAVPAIFSNLILAGKDYDIVSKARHGEMTLSDCPLWELQIENKIPGLLGNGKKWLASQGLIIAQFLDSYGHPYLIKETENSLVLEPESL